MFFFVFHIIMAKGEIPSMSIIKGYVHYYDRFIPITWARESKKFVYDVKRLHKQGGEWFVDSRLFDDKVCKDEIAQYPLLLNTKVST